MIKVLKETPITVEGKGYNTIRKKQFNVISEKASRK